MGEGSTGDHPSSGMSGCVPGRGGRLFSPPPPPPPTTTLSGPPMITIAFSLRRAMHSSDSVSVPALGATHMADLERHQVMCAARILGIGCTIQTCINATWWKVVRPTEPTKLHAHAYLVHTGNHYEPTKESVVAATAQWAPDMEPRPPAVHAPSSPLISHGRQPRASVRRPTVFMADCRPRRAAPAALALLCAVVRTPMRSPAPGLHLTTQYHLGGGGVRGGSQTSPHQGCP